MRRFGLDGYSKGFAGKLVGMKVIWKTNILTAPRDIYGISPGATLVMWQSSFAWCDQGTSMLFLPNRTVHGWGGNKDMITRPWGHLGYQGHFLAVDSVREMIVYRLYLLFHRFQPKFHKGPHHDICMVVQAKGRYQPVFCTHRIHPEHRDQETRP